VSRDFPVNPDVLQAPDTMVVVDNEANVQDLQRAAESASVEISLLIDWTSARTERASSPENLH